MNLKEQTVSLLWKSWYGNELLELSFPAGWKIHVARPHDAPAMSRDQIAECFRKPLFSPPLRQLARGRKTVAIAIDDLHRPTSTYQFIDYVIDELLTAGVSEHNIFFIVSLGVHRPLARPDLVKKLGEDVVRRFRIYNHHPYENLVDLGTSSHGSPIAVNRLFYEADLKIGIGAIVPHPYAGFGGGGKIVLPGLTSCECVAANHQPGGKKFAGKIGVVEDNWRRQEMDEVAQKAGLEFIVNVVVNSRAEIAGLFAGKFPDAFYEGTHFAKKVYATQVKYQSHISIFNAFPKDTDIIQALNALNVWSDRADPERALVRKGGVIVIILAASEGVGYHGLAGYGMKQHYRRDAHPAYRPMLEGRTLILFSPNLNQAELLDHYSEKVVLVQDPAALVEELKKQVEGEPEVVVYPCASIQLDNNG